MCLWYMKLLFIFGVYAFVQLVSYRPKLTALHNWDSRDKWDVRQKSGGPLSKTSAPPLQKRGQDSGQDSASWNEVKPKRKKQLQKEAYQSSWPKWAKHSAHDPPPRQHVQPLHTQPPSDHLERMSISQAPPAPGSSGLQALAWRQTITRELLNYYWTRFEENIISLAYRKEADRMAAALQARVDERLARERSLFSHGKDGPIDQASRKARLGLWHRFHEGWKRREIEAEERARSGPSPDRRSRKPHYRSMFDARTRELIERVDQGPDRFLFPRKRGQPEVMFLGAVENLKTVTSPERMVEIAAAQAVEDYTLRMYPESCARHGFQRVRIMRLSRSLFARRCRQTC